MRLPCKVSLASSFAIPLALPAVAQNAPPPGADPGGLARER